MLTTYKRGHKLKTCSKCLKEVPKLWKSKPALCFNCKERKPLEKKVYKINKMSDKGKKEIQLYTKLRKPFLEQHPVCEAKVKCLGAEAKEVHHKRGRGPYLNDVSTWLPVCRACHNWVEEHPEAAAELGLRQSRIGSSL